MRTHSLLIFALLLSSISAGQQKASLSSLFYERTDYLANGIAVGVGPNITYSTRWNREDELFAPAYVNGTFSTRPRLGWNVSLAKYWLNQRVIFFNRIDLGLQYKRFNGSESFEGIDTWGGTISEKRIFHENRAGIYISGSNIKGFNKFNWLQTKVGAGFDYAYKRSTKGEFYNLPRNYSEPWRGGVFVGLGIGRQISDGLFATIELEAPLIQFYPGRFVDQRMYYFHSHYYPIQLKASIMWGKHKPKRTCDDVNKGPENVSKEDAGKHKSNDLFGPDMKKSKKKKKKRK